MKINTPEIYSPNPLPQAGVDGVPKDGSLIENGIISARILETIDQEYEDVTEIIDSQYEGTTATLSTFGLYDSENLQESDVEAPSQEEVKTLLARELTSEQLEVIKQMQKPVLQLIPVTSGDRYLEALNSYKPMEDQKDTYLSNWTKGVLERADKRDGVSDKRIIGWKVAITEGVDAPAVLEGDNVAEVLENRLAWFEEKYGSKGVSGVDFKRYELLQMMGLATSNPKPLDDLLGEDDTWTVLNDEPVYDGRVAGGYWLDDDCLINLSEDIDCGRNYSARFRVSVVVDVPKP